MSKKHIPYCFRQRMSSLKPFLAAAPLNFHQSEHTDFFLKIFVVKVHMCTYLPVEDTALYYTVVQDYPVDYPVDSLL